MKAHIVFVGLIASQMLCLAEDNPAAKKKGIWGASHIRELARCQRLEFFDISQGPEHLVGSFVLNRCTKGTVPQLVIQGHLNKRQEFTPNVSLEVSDLKDRNWKTIESSFSDRVDVTLTGAPHIDKLFIRIQLDAFQPYFGKFKFCRIALQTGESDVFPLEWLTEDG